MSHKNRLAKRNRTAERVPTRVVDQLLKGAVLILMITKRTGAEFACVEAPDSEIAALQPRRVQNKGSGGYSVTIDPRR